MTATPEDQDHRADSDEAITIETATTEAEIAEAAELAVAAIAQRSEQASASLDALLARYHSADGQEQIALSA